MTIGEQQIFDENLGQFVSSAGNPFTRFVNLADSRLGAVALAASDEWFAPKERLLDPAPPVFISGKYDDHGKWMDGWETRRRRIPGHDWSVIRLGVPGLIRGVDIDTSHFVGNYPPAASLDACHCDDDPTEKTIWIEILPAAALRGNAHHLLAVTDERVWSHLRLNIYPDGGVARLRIYGEARPDWSKIDHGHLIDLAAIVNGGRLVSCSDQFYGSPANMLYPGIGANMGEGWETRRRREPGNEWAVFTIGRRGRIRRIIVDTTHFKGNYPDRCSILAADVTAGTDQLIVPQSMFWPTLLPEQMLGMDSEHVFQPEIINLGPITHVRFNNIPDGGVNRLRLFGKLA